MIFKKAIVILGIGAALAIIANLTYQRFTQGRAKQYVEHQYIFDKTFPGSIAIAILPAGTKLPDGTSPGSALDFFRGLSTQFAGQSIRDLETHFKRVGDYFNSIYGAADAQRLLVLYRKYLQCEIEIDSNAKFRSQMPDPSNILLLLYQIQTFRRDRLGANIADALFGQEVKEREYALRRSLIIDAPNLYGKAKEERLRQLKLAMWRPEDISSMAGETAYDRYQLKTRLYSKDLAEMSEEQRKRTQEEFRKEFFPKEAIERLEEVDHQLEVEKETLVRYRAAERQILADGKLSSEEKNAKIKALQDDYFGSEAEAFRRREAIYVNSGK
ncbi:MAG: lipase secretion chaperone [Desulfobacteraceae bacterium]|nr:lipase secretion chaperone [Desulfobacteraceae bacterium]